MATKRTTSQICYPPGQPCLTSREGHFNFIPDQTLSYPLEKTPIHGSVAIESMDHRHAPSIETTNHGQNKDYLVLVHRTMSPRYPSTHSIHHPTNFTGRHCSCTEY